MRRPVQIFRAAVLLATGILHVFGLHPNDSDAVLYGMNLLATEAFFFAIDKRSFGNLANAEDVEFHASLANLPDLPSWMNYRHPNGSDKMYLYGAPDKPGTFKIEVVGMNTHNFETNRTRLTFEVRDKNGEAKYGVQIKFSNMNVEDLFDESRLRDLVEIFRKRLWKDERNAYITSLASAIEAGGRLPLNPRDKEGAVVTIGGVSPFSEELLSLEREVQPLRNRFPCPPKQTSVEYVFRNKNFTSEWCSFRLIRPPEPANGGPSSSPISLTSEDYHPRELHLSPEGFLLDFLVSIGVPALLALFFVTCLTYVMFCNRDGSAHAVQMNHQLNQYGASARHDVQSSQEVTTKLSGSEHHPSPASSLPRSRAGSPSSLVQARRSVSGASPSVRNACPPPPYTPPK